MNYYFLSADIDRFLALGPTDESLWSYLIDWLKEEKPISLKWKPFEVKGLTDHLEGETQSLGLSDVIDLNLTSNMVFTYPVKEALGSLFENTGEFLPIHKADETLYVYHCTNIIDALDVENSDVERFSSGKIMNVRTYKLLADKLIGADIFRLKESGWRVIVSESVREKINKAGFDGFNFELIYSLN